MSLGPDGFVILFLSTLIPFSGTLNLSVNQVSSIDQKSDLDRQMQRLKDYAAARGYTVAKEAIEIASDLNDMRPKFLKLLADISIGTMLVEHKDRGNRFGWSFTVTLLQAQGRDIEAIFPTDTHDDLVNNFVSVITSMAARIYGRRNSKRRAEKIKQYVEQVMIQEENSPERQAIRTVSDGNSFH